MQTRRHSVEQGFTLIELLTVTLILGVLASIAIPTLLGQRTQAQQSDVEANVRNTVVIVEAYFLAHDTYPADGADLVALGAATSAQVSLTFARVGPGYRIGADHALLDGDGDGNPVGDEDAWYDSSVGAVRTP